MLIFFNVILKEDNNVWFTGTLYECKCWLKHYIKPEFIDKFIIGTSSEGEYSKYSVCSYFA